MKPSKTLFALSLARRAGKLVMGFDAVMESAEKGETLLVVVSSSLSPKTQKEAAFRCERCQTEIISADLPLEEAEAVLGKRSGIFGVTDEGFRDLLRAAETAADPNR